MGWGQTLPAFKLLFRPSNAEIDGIVGSTRLETALGVQIPSSVDIDDDAPPWQFAFRLRTDGYLQQVWHRVIIGSVPPSLTETALFERKDGPPSFWFHPGVVLTPLWVAWCRDDDGATLRTSTGTTRDVGESSFSLVADGVPCPPRVYPQGNPSRTQDGFDFQCASAIRSEATVTMRNGGNPIGPLGFRGEDELAMTMRPANAVADPNAKVENGRCWTWWFAP